MQPSDRALARMNGPRLNDRASDELIGLVRGILSDGEVRDAEIRYLHRWLVTQEGPTTSSLIDRVVSTIEAAICDGTITDADRDALTIEFRKLVGEDVELGEVLKATDLPLCDPAPKLTFEGRCFCFTGTFAFGKRTECEAAVMARGGTAGPLRRKTHCLIVGSYATESWRHSAWGSKVEDAVRWRDVGHPIAIVSEDHWASHL